MNSHDNQLMTAMNSMAVTTYLACIASGIAAQTVHDVPSVQRWGVFDLVLSRDMLGHIEDLDRALAECARVLSPDGVMVIHEVFAKPLLEPQEAQMLCADVATIPERMSVRGFETAVDASGFSVESLDLVGSAAQLRNQKMVFTRARRTRAG